MSVLKVAAINNASAVSGGLAISATGNVTGAGMDLVATQTFTTSSAVSFNNCFTSTYDHYRIVYSTTDFSSALANETNIRMRVGGVDNSTSGNYKWARTYGGFSTSGSQNTSTTQFQVAASTDAQHYAVVDIFYPQAAQATTYVSTAYMAEGATNNFIAIYGGTMTVTTQYDGFTIFPIAGTFNGVVRVYGYKN